MPPWRVNLHSLDQPVLSAYSRGTAYWTASHVPVSGGEESSSVLLVPTYRNHRDARIFAMAMDRVSAASGSKWSPFLLWR
jgi:hypothetical protein